MSRPETTVADLLGNGPGRAGFIERHGLWGDEEYAAAAQTRRVIDERGIKLVRLSFPDQHGLLRGKTLTSRAFEVALRDGCGAPATLVAKDTSGQTIVPVFGGSAPTWFERIAGAGDLVLIPDPTTFRILPWAPGTGWTLCDVYFPDGAAVPHSARHVLRRLLNDLAQPGYELVVGLEVEFHVFRRDDEVLLDRPMGLPGAPRTPPAVAPTSRGYQLLSEEAIDEVDAVVQFLHDGLHAVDVPVRSFEQELGPSQLELTLDPQEALRAADNLVLCRSAIKQLCRRHGYHATFMCRPQLPELSSSGWHLHQALFSRDVGTNVFAPSEGSHLSIEGQRYLGGLLAHARSATVFTTPTVNGYKRFRPFSMAPDHVVWGADNRGAMIRVVGAGQSTRLENRAGEPAANPYLYIAAQVASGMDGLCSKLEPGAAADTPYADGAPRLPSTLMDALAALRGDRVLAERIGVEFVDYILALKQAEVDRYLSAVTDWEHREYFELM